MAGYIGSATAVVSNGGEKKVTVTASGGQTAISNVSYAPGQVDVYHNGVRLVDGTDYTATNGTSITLTVAAAANDQIVVRSFNTFQVSDNVSASGGGSFAADVTFATGADIITSSLGTSNFRAGVNAGNSITSGGNQNVVVGDEAGTAITTGDQNSILGYSAGVALTTGNRNTLLGSTAGDALVGAERNTAVGYGALHTETEGDRNTAVGVFALSTQNTTGGGNIYNTAVGYAAGNLLETGVQNTLIGALAGDALTEANFNVAIGSQALSTDTEGSRSIAIGQHALQVQNFTTATDVYNVAVGYDAGNQVRTGTSNTIMGALSGDGLTVGSGNTLIGFESGSYGTNLTTGATNTLVGAYNNTTAVDSAGAMGFGYNLDCAAGYTTLGSGTSDIRAAHGVATWATVSDERYKKDITDSTAGLSFINALRPRTWNYKTLGELPETFRAYEADSTEVFKNTQTNHGFIAQEVKVAIDADSGLKDGFRLWDDREDGSQEVAEAALIPVLTKAIQELSAQVDALTARLTTLEG